MGFIVEFRNRNILLSQRMTCFTPTTFTNRSLIMSWESPHMKTGLFGLMVHSRQAGMTSQFFDLPGWRSRSHQGIERLLITTTGWGSSCKHTKLTWPKVLRKFKSRAWQLDESFNGRIKNFKCMEERFRHGVIKHQILFEVVCVICQYQLENGSPLFDT